MLPDVTSPSPAVVPPRRRWLRRVVRVACVAGQLVVAPLVVFGVALHMTIRDGWSLLAPAFYALPPVVLAVLTVFGLLMSRGHRVWIIVAGGVGLWAVSQSVVVWPVAIATPASVTEVRLMSWNSFNDHLAGPNAVRLSQTLADADADLVLLIEAGLGHDEQNYSAAGWRQRADGYEPYWLRNRFEVLIKNTRATQAGEGEQPIRDLQRVDDLPLPPGGYNRTLSWTMADDDGVRRLVTLIMLHPISDPTWDRTAVFAAVTEQVEQLAARGPVVLCGDFNLPATSCHLDRLRRTMRLTSEVGRGLRYRGTWPQPVPVLELDQMWVSRHFRVRDVVTPFTLASDHQPIVANLSLLAE